jgi:hypothetical protein
MDSAVGEADRATLRGTFDPRLKLEFQGSKIPSDAGLLPFRDLDDALGLTDLAGEVLADTRTGQNSRHTLIAQLRQSGPAVDRGWPGRDAEGSLDQPSGPVQAENRPLGAVRRWPPGLFCP